MKLYDARTDKIITERQAIVQRLTEHALSIMTFQGSCVSPTWLSDDAMRLAKQTIAGDQTNRWALQRLVGILWRAEVTA